MSHTIELLDKQEKITNGDAAIHLDKYQQVNEKIYELLNSNAHIIDQSFMDKFDSGFHHVDTHTTDYGIRLQGWVFAENMSLLYHLLHYLDNPRLTMGYSRTAKDEEVGLFGVILVTCAIQEE